MHKRYSAIALCCAAAALAGCGSSSGDSASNPNGKGPANVPVFKASLNALCKQGNTAVAKAGGNPAKALAILNRYLPQFKALTTSGSLGTEYQSFVANLEAEAAALKTQNVAAIKSAQQKNAALAKELGVPNCAG
jgi:hypothetical protein